MQSREHLWFVYVPETGGVDWDRLDESPAGTEYVLTCQAPVDLMGRKKWEKRRREEVSTVACQVALDSRQPDKIGGGSNFCSCQAP